MQEATDDDSHYSVSMHSYISETPFYFFYIISIFQKFFQLGFRRYWPLLPLNYLFRFFIFNQENRFVKLRLKFEINFYAYNIVAFGNHFYALHIRRYQIIPKKSLKTSGVLGNFSVIFQLRNLVCSYIYARRKSDDQMHLCV